MKLTPKEIRSFRMLSGMSQGKFAKELGLKSYGWISAIENGKVKISARTEKQIRELMDKHAKISI